VDLLLKYGLRLGAAGTLAMLLAVSARAQGDLRPSVIDIEWRTPNGYERCAAVITARRATGVEAWTAGHCTTLPFSVARFFDGYLVSGSAVRVLLRSETVDAALLEVTVDAVRTRNMAPAFRARSAPPMGTALTIIGHPTSALRGANEGRWTTTAGRMGEVVPDQATGALEYEVYCSRCGPGDSGSGVFDPEGRLIGIVYGVTEIENVAGGRLPDGLYADVIPVAALH
jgi:hypothetical protein